MSHLHNRLDHDGLSYVLHVTGGYRPELSCFVCHPERMKGNHS